MEAKRIKEEAESELTRLEQSFPRAAVKQYKNLELKKRLKIVERRK